MRFQHVNAEESAMWKWFKFRQGDQECEVELKLLTREELAALQRKHPNDVDRQTDHIAEHWFRNIRGAFDAKGETIQNTPQLRRELLKDQDLWLYINSKLASAAAWRLEGNGDSGSA